MIELVGITIGLALVDCLNPATISTMALLLPLVKRVEHSLSFLFSTYFVYLAGGLILYFGADKFLVTFLTGALNKFSLFINIGEIVIGVVITGIGLWLFFKNRQQNKQQTGDPVNNINLKSLKPFPIFIFGIVSTISDLPTAFPLIGFIGKMIDSHSTPTTFFLFLIIYVFIYVAPLIILYVVFKKTKEKIKNITLWFNRVITNFNKYALPPLLVVIGAWIIFDGINRF